MAVATQFAIVSNQQAKAFLRGEEKDLLALRQFRAVSLITKSIHCPISSSSFFRKKTLPPSSAFWCSRYGRRATTGENGSVIITDRLLLLLQSFVPLLLFAPSLSAPFVLSCQVGWTRLIRQKKRGLSSTRLLLHLFLFPRRPSCVMLTDSCAAVVIVDESCHRALGDCVSKETEKLKRKGRERQFYTDVFHAACCVCHR